MATSLAVCCQTSSCPQNLCLGKVLQQDWKSSIQVHEQALSDVQGGACNLYLSSAHLQECHDMLAVLLMVRINYHHRVMMAKRRIPALDGYMDRINLLLWPRFKVRACALWGCVAL